MMRLQRLVIVVWLTLIFCGIFDAALANDREPLSLKAAQIPDNITWHTVAPSARAAILEFLMIQSRGNYEKIRSLQASYEVLIEHYVSPDYVKSFGSRVPRDISQELIAHFEKTLRVAIDMESNSIFRQYNTTRFQLLTTDSKKPVVIPDVWPVDNCSIVTTKDYKYFNPKMSPATHAVVMNHPKGKNKRFAFRVPAEQAHNQEYGDLIDPRNFYCCARTQKAWEELQVYLTVLKGEKGFEQQQKADQLKIDQADYKGNTWYRLSLPVASKDGSTITFTSIWSSLAGFNPVNLSVLRRDNIREAIIRTKLWKWATVDGIFIPVFFHESWVTDISNNMHTYNLTVTQKKCVLNAPLDPKQFDYSALGLKNGDLILDDIEQTAYIIDENGQVKHLAAYNEKYVPGLLPAKRLRWLLILSGIVAVIVIMLAKMILRKRLRGAGTT